MRNLLLIGLSSVLIVGAALAQSPTPIESQVTAATKKLRFELSQQAKFIGRAFDRVEDVDKRLSLLERFWSDVDTKSSLLHEWKVLTFKVTELERKVSGLQRQVTVLHAKVNECRQKCAVKASACGS